MTSVLQIHNSIRSWIWLQGRTTEVAHALTLLLTTHLQLGHVNPAMQIRCWHAHAAASPLSSRPYPTQEDNAVKLHLKESSWSTQALLWLQPVEKAGGRGAWVSSSATNSHE